MSTRFHLTYNDTVSGNDILLEVTPTAWSAGWNKTTLADTHHASTFPIGGTVNDPVPTTLSGTSGHFTAVARFVSAALAAQTISGTIKGRIACFESVNTMNLTLAIGVKVVDSTGADRGTLLAVTASDDTTNTPPEFSVGSSNVRPFQNASENTSITLSSVDAQLGDRIVIEIGARQASTSTSSGFGVRIGTGPGPLAEITSDTDVSTNYPWVEFSGDITFAPYYFGSAATPADGAAATGTADPTAVTPPADMKGGDLVFMIGHQRATGATLAMSEAGGQSWTSETAIGTTNVTARVFWCVFNGTWGSDPSVDFSATTCNSVQMHVFRSPLPDMDWRVNQAQVELDIAAAATQTITGQTTTGSDPTVTLAGWFTADDNSWGSISGTGWAVAGSAQYRNTSGSDQSSTYAYKIQTAAGATGNVSMTQTANGNDAATTFIISMAMMNERRQPPVSHSYAINRAAFH